MDNKKLDRISQKSKYIFLDADGTLLASNEAMCEILNRKYDKRHSGCEVTDWNYTNLYPTTEKEIESIFESEDFFRRVKFIKGARKYLTKYRNKIIIVTKSSNLNYARKRIWFDKMGFSDIPIVPLDFKISKGIINMKNSLFIDDCTYNLKESNAKWKVQFMEYNDNRDREWQRNWRKDRLYKW